MFDTSRTTWIVYKPSKVKVLVVFRADRNFGPLCYDNMVMVEQKKVTIAIF